MASAQAHSDPVLRTFIFPRLLRPLQRIDLVGMEASNSTSAFATVESGVVRVELRGFHLTFRTSVNTTLAGARACCPCVPSVHVTLLLPGHLRLHVRCACRLGLSKPGVASTLAPRSGPHACTQLVSLCATD